MHLSCLSSYGEPPKSLGEYAVQMVPRVEERQMGVWSEKSDGSMSGVGKIGLGANHWESTLYAASALMRSRKNRTRATRGLKASP